MYALMASIWSNIAVSGKICVLSNISNARVVDNLANSSFPSMTVGGAPRVCQNDPSGKTGGHPSTPFGKNIPLSRISDSWHRPLIPALPEGRFAIVTRCGSGCGGRGSAGATGGDRAGNRESGATRYDTAWSQRFWSSSEVSTREPPASRSKPSADGEVVWSRRPGVWRQISPWCGGRPARASISGEATGAIVQRSPRRARRTPLKPSAQGRPGDRQHL